MKILKIFLFSLCLSVFVVSNSFAAITITTGAWAAGTTSCTAVIPATPAAGDLMILFVGGKPYNMTINTPANWTPVTGTQGTNGTVANATDAGSVSWKAFYRYWQSGDANPVTSITTGNTALCVIHRFSPTGGSTLDDPIGAGAKGSDTTSGTGYSATMDVNPGITAGDMLCNFTVIAGNNSTFGSPTMSATGATIGTVLENPATEGTTGGGLDCEASASHAECTAGTASAAPVVGWTLSVAQTGGGALVRIRETAGAGGPSGVPNSLMMTGLGT